MFDAQKYMHTLVRKLKEQFGERLVYVGLQGSYLRGDATEHSDIDPMVVIDELTTNDLLAYRQIIEEMDEPEKSCGFLCAKAQLAVWNRLEICHLLHSTRDIYGTLSALVPDFSAEDMRCYVRLSLNNLLHELIHRRIHGSDEKNIAHLPQTYKMVFFILQGLCWLEKGVFPGTLSEMRECVSNVDRTVFENTTAARKGKALNFEQDFETLFNWIQQTLLRL